ncbi:hypothetical protein BDZ91DRAFT_750599 [Kalaharituber pfeilii]|nr:hypothetical protein BDZ91DRAFT_750599 [Kalaharituber pfeilii]
MRKRIRNARAAIVMLILEGISMSCQRANQPDREACQAFPSRLLVRSHLPAWHLGLARRLGLTCRLRKRMISMRA